VPGPVDKPYPTSTVAASARWPFFLRLPGTHPRGSRGAIHPAFIARCYRRRCPAAPPQACTTQILHSVAGFVLGHPRAWGFIEDSLGGVKMASGPAPESS
jgi:hypothetical protein